MQANALKSVHVTFTTRTGMCPPVHMNNVQLPCADQVKYLGLHLDGKLTWHHHIFTKRKQLGLTLTKMFAAIPTQQAPSLQIHPQTHLDLRHPTLGHSIHIQHRDPRTLSIKGPAHNRRRTVVCAEQSHPLGPPNVFRQRRNLPLKQPILHSSHHTPKWPNINPHGDSRQQAFAKTRAKRSSWQIVIVIVVLVILVFKV
jgi:hypothetical protein